MSQIQFKKLEYKNIMSVGNHPIKVDLDRHSTTLLIGPNGSGKSTLAIAFAYCYFGKLLNNMKLGQAINSINGKKLLVKGTFQTKGEKWEVIRGEKPKRFEIYRNDELVDQYANARDQQKFLELILGMDFKLFTQVAVINKERYVPFMEMGAGDRRKIVEDILDISIFSIMNDTTKRHITDLSKLEATLDRDREVKLKELEGEQKLIQQIQQSIKEQAEVSDEQIKEKQSKIDSLNEELEDIITQMKSIDLVGKNKVKKMISEYEKLADDLTRKQKQVKKEADFFRNNENCPTCEQPISNEFKNNKILEAEQSIKEVNSVATDMTVELEQLIEQRTEYEVLEGRYNDLIKNEQNIMFQISSLESDIKHILDRSDGGSSAEKLQIHIDAYNEQETCLEKLRDDLNENIRKREEYEQLRDLLKDDGIKALIIKEYLAIINKKINEFLVAMGYYVNMTVDENFNEKFHSLHKEGFTYNNLSTGQKTRVNLAITLALLQVASIKNSASCNVMILDELLENVDSTGIKDVMTLFREKLPNKNIWVATQRAEEFRTEFRSSVEFKLNGDFTELST